MKKFNFSILIIGILSIILIITWFSFQHLHFCYIDNLKLGNLVILGLTLIVIMIYTFDTHRIANIQQNNYYKPQVVHNITAIEENNNVFDVGFDLFNSSSFYVEAEVNLELKCCDDDVLTIPNDVYYGSTPWILPPNTKLHGHFKLDDTLLHPVNQTMAKLRETYQNQKAFKLVIDIACTSDYKISMTIPTIKYYFVFDRDVNGKKWSGWVLDI